MKKPGNLSAEVLRVFETLPDLYLIISPDLFVLTASDTYLNAIGKPRAEVVQKPLEQVFYNDPTSTETKAKDILTTSLQEVLATNLPYQTNRQLYKIPAGEKKLWRFIHVPVMDDSGEVTYIIHKLLEITGQDKQNQNIQLPGNQLTAMPLPINAPEQNSEDLPAKTLLQSVFAAATSDINVLKSVRNPKGEIIDFEYQLANGISQEANAKLILPGKRFSAILPDPEQKALFGILKKVVETGEERTEEVHYTAAGNDIYCHVRVLKIADGVVYSCEDITARKLAEKKLQQKHRRLKEAQAIGHIGSFEWNYPDEVIYWSDEMYRIHGLEPTGETIDFDQLFAFTHPEDLEGLKEVIRGAQQVNGFYTFKHRIIRLDGQLRYLFRRIYSWKNTAGIINNVSGTVQDITEQQLTEIQLKDQANFIRQVSATVPDMVSVIELATGELEYINRESLPSSGFSYEGLKEVTPEERMNLVCPQDQQAVMDYFKSFFSATDEDVRTLTYRAKDHSVEWQWFLVRGRVFRRNENGEATHCLNVIQNITDIKLAQEEVSRNLQVLQQAEEVAGMGSWEYDIATGTFHVSEGIYHNFGKEMGSGISPSIYLDYALEEDRPVAQKILSRLQTGQEPWEEIIRVRQNEQLKILKTKAIIIHNQEGKPVKVMGVDLDVTELKRLEKENLELRLAQQKVLLLAILEAQEEERRRISESLHNGIGQILYATKMHLDRVNLQAARQPFTLLKEAKQKADELLSEAIDETRRVSHELMPLLLKEHGLEVAIQDFCCRFATNSIKLTSHGLKERLDHYLETAIYRIAQELINNIVKHAQATRARIEVFREGDCIIMEAQDNGKGMDTRQSVHKGIGLKTIQDRVALLEGSLEIASNPGDGTLITISLPLSTNN